MQIVTVPLSLPVEQSLLIRVCILELANTIFLWLGLLYISIRSCQVMGMIFIFCPRDVII